MRTPLVFSGPLNRIIVNLNKPQIIGNGGELSDLEYLPTKTEYIEYLQIVDMHTSHLFGPLNDTIVDVNKPKIIRNNGELTYLDYLPTKQKMRNISRMRTHEPLIYWGPLNDTRIHFK